MNAIRYWLARVLGFIERWAGTGRARLLYPANTFYVCRTCGGHTAMTHAQRAA